MEECWVEAEVGSAMKCGWKLRNQRMLGGQSVQKLRWLECVISGEHCPIGWREEAQGRIVDVCL